MSNSISFIYIVDIRLLYGQSFINVKDVWCSHKTYLVCSAFKHTGLDET